MEKSNLPTHIAIIPDGNRRWARKHGLLPWKGHIEGAKRVEEVIKRAAEIGILYITVWGSSYDNLVKRTKTEVSALNKVYAEMAKRIISDGFAEKNEIRIRILGEWEEILNKDTVKALRDLEKATKNNKKMNATALIGYNGDREMLSAINSLAGKTTEESLKNALWTKDLPPVDMVIRTGGNPHLSAGFMMWDVRYSLLYFTDKLWPEFRAKDLDTAISYYSNQERRRGV